VRIIGRIVVALATSATALLVAAAVLDDFHVSTLTFPILVVEFAVILLITRAAVVTLVHRNVHALSSFVGLIGAFAALVVTDFVSDGLNIDGVTTWIWATLIVWGGMIVADLLFGRRLFRGVTGRER
jgi:putative membrane protein